MTSGRLFQRCGAALEKVLSPEYIACRTAYALWLLWYSVEWLSCVVKSVFELGYY